MPFADRYIERNQGSFSFYPPRLPAMEIIVVIPCYNEPDILKTIESLSKCEYPGVSVGTVVVINSPEGAACEIVEQNRATSIELEGCKKYLPGWMNLFAIDAQGLPQKHAGAGWARKIGMDWATGHFNNTGNPNGLIASLDADTLVDANYFTAIIQAFRETPDAVAATLYFEHPLNDDPTKGGIVRYELFMRYYRNALEYSGFPHAIYTLGSCFVVKAGAYVAQGGMNRRKAGEDFYFLHKLVPLGEIIEIKSTTVHPSARISNRVPFGTGPALKKIQEGESPYSETYPLELFG
ncbi:MAG: glycosyltransferase, partial [Prolixibacteraceae bacterium]|nr:glycosyltransferase [Prolixibacteraceae bacterium]